MPRLDAAAAVREIEAARHGKRQRAFHRAQRHIKIALRVGAIDLERAGHALRQAHEAHVILDQALKVIRFIQGKLRHRVPCLLLQPKTARLGIRLGIAPRWCEFIHYVWPKIP